MPAFYAHNEFGKEVFSRLPGDVARLINSERDLFCLGLQGPDVFFYYHPLKKNDVNDFGSAIHDRAGRDLFTKVMPIDYAGQVYLCGVLCHFTLDAMCHGYIGEYNIERNVGHAELEGEFEGYIMEQEGKNRLSTIKTMEFIPSIRSAKVISSVYKGVDGNPGISPEVVEDSLKSTKTFENIIRCTGSVKRNILYLGIKLSGHGNEVSGHIMHKVPDERFHDSNVRLYQLYQEAIPKAVELVTEYIRSFDFGTEGISNNPLLLYDFNGNMRA